MFQKAIALDGRTLPRWDRHFSSKRRRTMSAAPSSSWKSASASAPWTN